MTVVLIVLLLAFVQLLSSAVDYDLTKDSPPDHITHKMVRRLNQWIYSDGSKAAKN